METTLYLESEKVHLVADPEEWQARVRELALAGQEELFNPALKANPFLRMDAGLVRVFEALCSAKMDVQKFNIEPIPLDVLSVYGLAVREHYFDGVAIWYSPGHPDPVMVGTTGKEQYLMAQWGPEKLSLDECRARARTRWVEKIRGKLAAEMRDAQLKLADLEALADTHFAGEWTGIY